VPILTALLAFLIGGVVVAATGHNPLLGTATSSTAPA